MADEQHTDGGPVPPVPYRAAVDHLLPHQVELVRRVLRSGDVPFGIVRDEVVAPAEFADEVQRAVEWAAVEPTREQMQDDHPRTRKPLVKPPRGPLRDGRRQATRWRRFAGGVLDELLVGIPLVLADRAGASLWTLAVIHATYYVVPVGMFGWSIGKLWCGTRVVDRRTLNRPGISQTVVRWMVAALPFLSGLFLGLEGDWLTVLLMSVYAPIVVDLRGVHDYAAGTDVVERSALGPGIWVRSGRRATVTE